MPSPVQSNCDAHDTIANGQYGAVWSMGHTQQDDISVFCRRRTSNTTSPCRLLHIPVVLNDFHSRETTLNCNARLIRLPTPHLTEPERYKFILAISGPLPLKWCELIPLRKASAQAIANAF
ncbi:hypothetical protein TNCV_2575121 [Trichonephila clavipes]|nr:hypothetical protein TNCV_2575121 [Trichonephila clavipes]